MRIISIIVPVYNEAENIPLLYDKLARLGEEMREKYELEIIFVNDGSTDSGQKIISDLSDPDDRVKYIELSRNFGKEVALTAGINSCRGSACIMIDGDLQHPARDVDVDPVQIQPLLERPARRAADVLADLLELLHQGHPVGPLDGQAPQLLGRLHPVDEQELQRLRWQDTIEQLRDRGFWPSRAC